MKYRIVPEIVPFKEDSFTERGERVYSHLEVTMVPPIGKPVQNVIKADPGIGFTEEYIEDFIKDGLAALEKDFPSYEFKVVKVKPNQIRLEYAQFKGRVQ
jgi:hypothetical protein